MAVLEAVRGWDAYNGEEESGDAAEGEAAAAPEEEQLEEGEWSEDQIEHQLDSLVNRDYESLLIEHDEHMARLDEDAEEASVCESAFFCNPLSARRMNLCLFPPWSV